MRFSFRFPLTVRRNFPATRPLGVCAAVLLLACLGSANAQRTIGLITHNRGSLDSGYVLFAPITNNRTYLIDKCGRIVRQWNSLFIPGESAYLRPDGSLVRAGILNGSGSTQVSSCTEIYDWDGTLKWRFTLDSSYGQHHDFEIMPNGNLLLISHDAIATSRAMDNGRDPLLISGQFVSERLVELKPVGVDSAEIVWEWKAFDHLVQDYDNTKLNYGVVHDHPELINVNFPPFAVGEWLHFNSVRYNEALDQILVSAHHSSEIWILDHGTTTAQAASHTGGKRGKGGDLLYRWGNPQAYDQGAGTDQMLFGQHECLWVAPGRPDAGKIMLFNNGTGRPAGMYSSIEVITPPIDPAGNYSASVLPYLPVAPDWIYTDTPPTNIITQTAGGSEILSNGNLLICTGQMGQLIELDPTRSHTLWKYVIPVNSAGPMTQGVPPTGNPVYKSVFYPFDYPAFAGKHIVGGAPIELGQNNYDCVLDSGLVGAVPGAVPESDVFVFPNPASEYFSITTDVAGLTGLALYNALGAEVMRGDRSGMMQISSLPNGVYHLRADYGKRTVWKRVAVAR